jgi:hypothetical protein
MDLHWWKGVKQARLAAQKAGFDPVVVKWWDEPGAKPPFIPAGESTIMLTIHGQKMRVPASEWDSYQASQWRYAGFNMQQMMEWPLVFDRRSASREHSLRNKWFTNQRPKLLVNLSQTGTSPFPHVAQAKALLSSSRLDVVNLGSVRADRIFDLLGLYDHAEGLVTTDTATLHLAAASKIPYIALINNGGSGSIPRGNCIAAIRYAEFPKRLGNYIEALKTLGNVK